MKKFNLDVIKPGMMLHVKTRNVIGYLLRYAMNKWAKRICESLGVPIVKVKGNHDALFIRSLTTSLSLGECLMFSGGVLSPLSKYEQLMDSGDAECWVYEVIEGTEHDGIWASYNWISTVWHTGYNYSAYPRLLIKSLFSDWSESKVAWKRRIGDKAAGWEWDNWCSEGNGRAWRKSPPGINYYQTNNPTPMTTMQVAGEIPMKAGKRITLRLVKDAIIDV